MTLYFTDYDGLGHMALWSATHESDPTPQIIASEESTNPKVWEAAQSLVNSEIRFLVTECESHGTKFTEDYESSRLYQTNAHDDKRAGYHGAYFTDDFGWVDSWSCCADMRVANDGESIYTPL
jgi:hypothetical protein